MRFTRLLATLLVALLVFVAAAGCRKEAAAPPAGRKLERVSLGLNWFPEAEHGGFYAAQVHGYFREEGLDVEIIKGGAASPILQQVAGGERDFGVTNADNILFGRAQQAPVIALMAPLQTSPRCLLVHAGSGIERFDQIKNLTLAMSLDNAFSHYLRKKARLEGVRIVPYSGNVAPFLADSNYAQQGYVFSEPFVARKHGAKVNVLMLSDLGYNPYTSLLFASEKTIRERPELVRRMVRACLRGWQKYLDSPGATNARIHELNREMDLDILAFGAQQLRPLVLGEPPQPEGLGRMTLARWRTLVEQLVECNQLNPGAVDAKQAFTTEFLP